MLVEYKSNYTSKHKEEIMVGNTGVPCVTEIAWVRFPYVHVLIYLSEGISPSFNEKL